MALSIPTFYCISGKQSLLYVVSPACLLLFLVLWLTKILMIGTLQWRWKKERKLMLCRDWQCFSSISHDDARRSFVFISTIVLRVVVEYVCACKKCFSLWPYFQYSSSHFLASFECLWWFFQNCFTFLDGSHCIICKLRKTFAEEVVEFFCVFACIWKC